MWVRTALGESAFGCWLVRPWPRYKLSHKLAIFQQKYDMFAVTYPKITPDGAHLTRWAPIGRFALSRPKLSVRSARAKGFQWGLCAQVLEARFKMDVLLIGTNLRVCTYISSEKYVLHVKSAVVLVAGRLPNFRRQIHAQIDTPPSVHANGSAHTEFRCAQLFFMIYITLKRHHTRIYCSFTHAWLLGWCSA